VGVDLIFDIFSLATPDAITVTKNYAVVRLVSDLISLFSWISCTAILFFIASRDVVGYLRRRGSIDCGLSEQLLRFWNIALALELVRTYHWFAEFLNIGMYSISLFIK
jgi:hypothetical protein